MNEMDSSRFVPPHCLDSEMSILGAVFVDNGCMDTISGIINADDFFKPAHRSIFAAMYSLAEKNTAIDSVTLADELKTRGELEDVGGVAYLYGLADFVPMAENVAHYCRIVAGKSASRHMILGAREAIALAFEGKSTEAKEKLEAAIEPSLEDQRSAVVSVREIAKSASKRIEERYENKGQITGIPYGLDDLDKVTLGLHPGELIIIAGRPSMGKTAFLGNIIKSTCLERQDETAMLFNLEMLNEDTVDRFSASYGVKYQHIRSGRLEENDWPKLHKAFEKIHDWPLVMDDTPAITLRDLRAKARKQARQGKLSLIGIDYLQLMALSDPKQSRVQGLGEISRGLKQLAKELMVPVIALSQLNRSVDSRQDKRPVMSDLRDSGEIEQDADVILFPYRPAAYCEKCKDKIDDNEHNWKEHQGKAEIIIEKQRAGERNITIPAVWLGEFQRFDNMTMYHDEECPY